jgi:hypothetical protein
VSRDHLKPQPTGWAFGLTNPTVAQVEDSLRTLQSMWDHCDELRGSGRTFGGTPGLMRAWSDALTVVEQLAQRYLSCEEPAGPITYHLDDAGSDALLAYATMAACVDDETRKALVNWVAHGARATMGGGRIALTRRDWSEKGEARFLPLAKLPAPSSAPGRTDLLVAESLTRAISRSARIEDCKDLAGLAHARISSALSAAPSPAAANMPQGIYVASRASSAARPAMWRGLRDAGWPITSSWIDEAGEGETGDFCELWSRIDREIRSSRGLVIYAEPEDFPLKGAYIEAGIAIGAGLPVAVVLPGVQLEARSDRPMGSWIRHPAVTLCATLEEARRVIETSQAA